MTTLEVKKRPLEIPTETILDILDQVVTLSSGEHTPIALSSNHPTTRTLIAFTTVCKAVSIRAIQHLYTHCLYIDSFRRLQAINYTLNRQLKGDSLVPYATSLFAASLYLSIDYNELPKRKGWGRGVVPRGPDSHMISEINTLLSIHLSQSIEKCVIKFPFDPWWTWITLEENVSLILLHKTLESLTSMRFFILVGWRPMRAPCFGSNWNNLKLIYFDSPTLLDNETWVELGKLSSLETLIIYDPSGSARADDLCLGWSRVNGSRNVTFDTNGEILQSGVPVTWGRHLNIVLVDCLKIESKHAEQNAQLISIHTTIQPGEFNSTLLLLGESQGIILIRYPGF